MRIPLVTANRAADVLIDWFGPDDLKNVVGGERWWQVRGLDGIDGEWITEREYLSKDMVDVPAGQKMSEPDKDILRMECLDTVMVCLDLIRFAIVPTKIFSFIFTEAVISGAPSVCLTSAREHPAFST